MRSLVCGSRTCDVHAGSSGQQWVSNNRCDDGSALSSMAATGLPEVGRRRGFARLVPRCARQRHRQVSDADVNRQIRIMNLGYSGLYGGYDQGFRFELVGVTRTNNAE
jgi:hypothetical protein